MDRMIAVSSAETQLVILAKVSVVNMYEFEVI